MRFILSHKYVAILFGALISTCIAVLIAAIYFMRQPVEQALKANVHRLQALVHAENVSTERHFAQSALLASHYPELASAIVKKDHYKVMELSKEIMNESGSDFMTVTDTNGIVIGRGHSEKWRDNVLNQETVRRAIDGEPSSAIVSGTVVPFTIRASQPIMQDNKIVGTLSIGKSLVTPDYLDWLKDMFGTEISIFKGSARKMTTIKKDGERFIGYKINSPEIEQGVLRQGNIYFTQTKIDGTPYESAYWPMRNADGIITGMWAIGIPRNDLEQAENAAIKKTIFAALCILIFQLIVSTVIIHRVLNGGKQIN